MTGMELFWQLASAFLGSFGFAILFHVRGLKLFVAGLGGMATWGFYLLMHAHMESLLVANLFAALFAGLFAEIMARLLRSPATVFAAPAVITMVPGGSLYYTLYNAIAGNAEVASEYGQTTWDVAVGIAIGLAAVTSVFHLLTVLRQKYQTKPQ
ncbi:threonine/serine exporter family protein [Candidatus Avoscillospira sp. LCP25S3_F1]|uniref:threonine/serine exporter family protein n=1 Tax=Candidatus Avoscillospira sp. LCP25S3_F1 TaxID=3438825 RepID=UPI003F9165CE